MHEFMAVPETDRAGQAATLEAWRKATATRKAAEKAADEAAAFVMALDELNHKHNAPEMVPSVQQLDFASIAAGVLA